MTTEKTAILFISGIVFFFGGIISFLHFFYHPPQEVKGISIKRDISITPTASISKKITPSASPSPTLVIPSTIVKSQPIQQSFIPKKPKAPASSSHFTPANWAQGVATITNEDSSAPIASDSAASSSAEPSTSTESSRSHGKADLEIIY